jgi:hypothetical protein
MKVHVFGDEIKIVDDFGRDILIDRDQASELRDLLAEKMKKGGLTRMVV